MRSLNVFYESQLVGRMKEDDELVYSFEYADSWLASGNRVALSLAMPMTQKVFGNRITRSFFENLLPEGEVREQRLCGSSGCTNNFTASPARKATNSTQPMPDEKLHSLYACAGRYATLLHRMAIRSRDLFSVDLHKTTAAHTHFAS